MPRLCVIPVVLALLHGAAPDVVAGQNAAGRAAVQARKAPPPGWRETLDKTLDLTLAGKHTEVIAIYEQWVAKYPDFGDAHHMLGGAYESLGRDVRMSRTPDALSASTKHFESAAVHIRRGIDLEGKDATFMSIRPLIDLYGLVGLNRPAEYERLVQEGLKRFPADPLAHGYAIELLARNGQPIADAVRTARAAMPQTADARADLAGSLADAVRDYGAYGQAYTTPLLREALGLVDEALKLTPAHAGARDVRARILREQAKHAPAAP